LTILDCENTESALMSLQEILGLRREHIQSILTSFDLDAFYAKNQDVHYPELAFVRHFSSEFFLTPKCDFTCWFHLTRRPKNKLEIEELIPLDKAIHAIWDYLYKLVSSEIPYNSWLRFRESVEGNNPHHNAFLYRHKLGDSQHWGPYGFLAKDFPCFSPNLLEWHYFNSPEIVEDICVCFQNDFGINLQQEYIKSTEPCIVKFKYESPRDSPIGYALFYLYCTFKGIQLDKDRNICFSTRGKTVPKEQIVSVEPISVH
jgi:hypothetical protein